MLSGSYLRERALEAFGVGKDDEGYAIDLHTGERVMRDGEPVKFKNF